MKKALVLRSDNAKGEVSCRKKDFVADLEKEEMAYLIFLKAGCEPCKELMTNLSSTDKEVGASFYIIDVDECEGIASRFKVTVMPTVVATEKGKEILRYEGKTRLDFE